MNKKCTLKLKGKLFISVADSGVGPGAVVTVKNNVRSVSHAHGTLGVVFDCKETGGVRICTQWGVITMGLSQNDYWIPRNRYVVRFRPDEDAVIDNELQTLKDQVLEGNFVEGSHSHITLQEYHRNLVGIPPQGRRNCRCKDGRCSRRCGCWNKMPCSSSCSCNGECDNPKNSE